MSTFGDKMRALRESKGWTQKFTAEKMEVSPQMYNNYERNKTNPSLAILKRVCDLYDISLDTLDIEDLFEFLKCVEIETTDKEEQIKTYKDLDEELHYIIPSMTGLGYDNLVHSDLYNDKINYLDNEYFFFVNKDVEYSPGRLKAGDLLYCEGIGSNEELDITNTYLIYSKTEDKYYVRKSLNPNLITSILEGLNDSTQKELVQNTSSKNVKDFLFLMPDLPASQSINMLILKKNEAKIIGQIHYVIYSPKVDLYENAGIDYRALIQKKWEEESAEMRKKINIIRQTNPDFLKE